MSIDLAQRGRSVFYLNFLQSGTGLNNCEASQIFNFGNIVEVSSDYIIAIERLIVPIHRVPHIESQTPAIIFVPIGAGLQYVINTPRAFSWKEFLDDINTQLAGIGVITCRMFLGQSGEIVIYFADFATYTIRINPVLQAIFDLNENLTIADTNGFNEVHGGSSLVDRFDQLHKVQVEVVGMNIQQEIIDTDRSSSILTDFIVPNTFSFSYGENLENQQISSKDVNIGYSVRQNIIYNAGEERRYVMLRGEGPVQNITLRCVAIYKDNTRNDIIMAPRSVFECKIAFFRK